MLQVRDLSKVAPECSYTPNCDYIMGNKGIVRCIVILSSKWNYVARFLTRLPYFRRQSRDFTFDNGLGETLDILVAREKGKCVSLSRESNIGSTAYGQSPYWLMCAGV